MYRWPSLLAAGMFVALARPQAPMQNFESFPTEVDEPNQSLFNDFNFRAWQEWHAGHFKQGTILFLRAAHHGMLDMNSLANVAWFLRDPAERSDLALTVSAYAYGRFHNDAGVMEHANTLLSAGRAKEARSVVEKYMGISAEETPASRLRAAQAFLLKPGRSPRFASFLIDLVNKHYLVDFELSADVIVKWTSEELKREGFYTFFIPEDRKNATYTYSVVGARSTDVTIDEAGNRVLKIMPESTRNPHVLLKVVHRPMRADLFKRIVITSDAPQSVLHALKPSNRIDPEGMNCRGLVKLIKGETRYETLWNISSWWSGVKYGTPPSSDSEGFLNARIGTCWEQSRGMISLMRAAGIPSRQTMVMMPQFIHGLADPRMQFGHILPDLYDPQQGWIQWEPGKPVGYTITGYIPLIVENPQSKDPIGNLEHQFYRLHHGPRADDVDAYRNVTVKLEGIDFE